MCSRTQAEFCVHRTDGRVPNKLYFTILLPTSYVRSDCLVAIFVVMLKTLSITLEQQINFLLIFFFFLFACIDRIVLANSFDTQGPSFIIEPPQHLEFTNIVDNHVDCAARGSPPPKIEWLMLDNSPATTIPRVSDLFLHITYSLPINLLSPLNLTIILKTSDYLRRKDYWLYAYFHHISEY